MIISNLCNLFYEPLGKWGWTLGGGVCDREMNGAGRNIEHNAFGWIHCISFSLFPRLYKSIQSIKDAIIRFFFPITLFLP
ncbi:hypothetical protein L1887_19645 [Cichorium endivia]|nr:hypothetical protein L1887_19645 [Cichorium endivia]